MVWANVADQPEKIQIAEKTDSFIFFDDLTESEFLPFSDCGFE